MHQSFALRVAGFTMLAFIAVLFLLPTPAAEVTAAATNSDNTLRILNVTLFNGEQWQEDMDVTISDGIISAIEESSADQSTAETIDGRGRFLLPGLIDAHTHTYGPAQRDALRFGVTTMLDMFTAPNLLPKAREARGTFDKTDKAALFSAGMLATVEGGHGTQYGIPMDVLSAPNQARAWVAKRQAEGSDYIKLVYIPGSDRIPSLDLATATAVIDAGHAAGLKVVAHISTQDAADELIDAGIDGFVHIFADSPVTDAFIAKAKRQNIFITPTLAVIAMVDGTEPGKRLIEDPDIGPMLDALNRTNLSGDFGGKVPGFSLTLAQQNVAKLHAAGIPILAGSDAPNPGTAHGATLHQEIALLVDAGLSADEAIAAATKIPADIFGLEDRGSIKVGSRADLLLVEDDPRMNVLATRKIATLLRNGYVVDRNLAPAVASDLQAVEDLGDFDNGIEAPSGYVWTSTSDEMMGGASSATIETVEPGADGSAAAMSINASVSEKFAYPWAGAYLGLADATQSVSLANFDTLQFFVKGTPGQYRLMMFSKDAFGAPPTLNFKVTDKWAPVSLSLANFAGFDAGQFTGMAFATPMQAGDYAFAIDHVKLGKMP